jgi:hypothetical protein
MGFGLEFVSGESLLPNPPAITTALYFLPDIKSILLCFSKNKRFYEILVNIFLSSVLKNILPQVDKLYKKRYSKDSKRFGNFKPVFLQLTRNP